MVVGNPVGAGVCTPNARQFVVCATNLRAFVVVISPVGRNDKTAAGSRCYGSAAAGNGCARLRARAGPRAEDCPCHPYPVTVPAPAPNPPKPLALRARQRLTHALQFQAVYGARASVTVGTMRVHACLNGLDLSRFGLSVGKRVGNAVERNRVKRLIREGFRLEQHAVPPGFDLVFSAGPWKDFTLEASRKMVIDASTKLAALWAKRTARRGAPPTGPAGEGA